MTIVKASNIFGKFFDVKFCILENVTTNATVGDLSNTRVLLLINKINATENRHLLGIYAVINQVTLCPNKIIHMFVT